MLHIKVVEEDAVAEVEVETKIKTEMNPSPTNKRKIKIQLKINSIVCLEHQLPKTLKSS